MTFKAKWVPPCLCDCGLDITAKWPRGTLEGGVSYKHPVPFTITDIQISNVCENHKHVLNEPIADNWHRKGYIELPIKNPTNAQKLYVYLWRYNGQKTITDICSCEIYGSCEDDGLQKKEIEIKHHPLYSKKSPAFPNLSVVDGHKEVMKLSKYKNKVILPELIKVLDPEEKKKTKNNDGIDTEEPAHPIKFKIKNGKLDIVDIPETPTSIKTKVRAILLEKGL